MVQQSLQISSGLPPGVKARIHQMSKKEGKYSSDIEVTNEDTGSTGSSTNSVLSVIGKSTSSLVAGTFFLVLAVKRDAYMITFFFGSIMNAIASKILKRVLNQDRPAELDQETDIKIKPDDKGMPSSHATSLGFICTFTALGLPYLTIPLLLYVITSLYYRVKINLHTKEQVYVGLVLGTTNGLLWNSLTVGSCIFLPSINLVDIVNETVLPKNGVLPVQYLFIPALVGLAIVGSFERRIKRWVGTKDKEK